MPSINPTDIPSRDFHNLLLSGVAPRPIALVSTIDTNGNGNLSPFSFFNAYASNPPIVAIGPAISARTGAVKDTWSNIIATNECTINAVTYSMVEQMNLSSCEYPNDVNEFKKCGLTPIESSLVAAPRVGESPFSLECRLVENIELFREEGGNGNIMLLRVVKVHYANDITTDGLIDPRKMDLVARMGNAWYARITPESCFELSAPRHKGIGFDTLPKHILESTTLTGNNLAQLASVSEIPPVDIMFRESLTSFHHTSDIAKTAQDAIAQHLPMEALALLTSENTNSEELYHIIAQQFLDQKNIHGAWQTLLISQNTV